MVSQCRVAMVCENLDPSFGGQAVTIPELVNALRMEGVLVTIFAGTNFKKRSDNVADANASERFYYLSEKFKVSIDLMVKLYRHRHKYDLIHCNNLWNMVPICAAIFCFLSRKGFVVSLRGMAMRKEIESNLLKRLSFPLVFKHLLNWANFLHTTYKDESDDSCVRHINVNHRSSAWHQNIKYVGA